MTTVRYTDESTAVASRPPIWQPEAAERGSHAGTEDQPVVGSVSRAPPIGNMSQFVDLTASRWRYQAQREAAIVTRSAIPVAAAVFRTPITGGIRETSWVTKRPVSTQAGEPASIA